MKDLEIFKEILKSIKYKPGFKMYLIEQNNQHYIKFEYLVYDVETFYKDGTTLNRTKLNNCVRIPEYFLDNLYIINKNEKVPEILNFIKRLIHQLEIHESNEWFSFEGQRVFNPHLKSVPV